MTATGAGPATHVALLRGINMAGHNKLPMKDLVMLFTEVGARDVRTYIQSGNVVFRAAARDATGITKEVAERIFGRFGLRPVITLRTAAQLARVVADNPFRKPGGGTDGLHLLFLAEAPDPDRVQALDPDRSPGDAFAVRGREVYLFLPNGVARSKLTGDWFERRLGTPCTGRNWRTVLKVLEMARG